MRIKYVLFKLIFGVVFRKYHAKNTSDSKSFYNSLGYCSIGTLFP